MVVHALEISRWLQQVLAAARSRNAARNRRQYHLAHSRPLLSDLPDIKGLLAPGSVRLTVISGIDDGAAGTSTQRRRTLWGELAIQMGGQVGYGLVAELEIFDDPRFVKNRDAGRGVPGLILHMWRL